MGLGFWFGLALFCLFAVLIFALVRLNGRLAQETEQHAAEKRQAEARQADQERANDIAKNADAAAAAIKKDAQRASGDDNALAERLRGSGRGRKAKVGADTSGKDRLR